MSWVGLASETLLWSSVGVGMFEVLGRPGATLCDCPALPTTPRHLREGLLLLQAAMTSGVALLWTVETGVDIAVLIMSGFAAWEWWRWWQHSRNGRKRMREKVLGVVREMGGRLVVEPVGA